MNDDDAPADTRPPRQDAAKDVTKAAPAQGAGADVVLLHGPTDDGGGVRVVRARNDRLEVGEVRPIVEGKPIVGELVRLKPREDAPRICDVEVLARVSATGARDAKGPAQVASDAYRASWERIFGPSDGAQGKPDVALN